jgi:LTXXQ motif family protein
MAAPHTPPKTPRVGPQQSAGPAGKAAGANAPRGPAQPSAAQTQQQPQVGAKGPSGQAGPKVAQPNPRDNQARQPGGAGAGSSAGVARTVAPQKQLGQSLQPPAGGRANAGRVLRNQAFAGRSAAGDPNARMLARSTFEGRFFDPSWRRHYARPIVIGWAGPLFWPYAYNDFVGYTFYPYAYDTFWPYAYDDLYDGMFGPFAQGYGGTYASVGRPQESGVRRPRGTEDGRSVSADLCSGRTAGLTDWPIERITQTVEPDATQRAALDELKDATAKALDILKAACPTALPSTPPGRIEAMRQRLEAMLQAARTVRPALEKFYGSLNDEQKARFNALAPDDRSGQQQAQGDLTQVCGERASGIASLPLQEIEREVRPDDSQRGALKQLQDATSAAADLLKSDCPSGQALSMVGRLEAMERRLDAMLRAVQTVQPALEKFYASLGDEQKERFNRLSPAQG